MTCEYCKIKLEKVKKAYFLEIPGGPTLKIPGIPQLECPSCGESVVSINTSNLIDKVGATVLLMRYEKMPDSVANWIAKVSR